MRRHRTQLKRVQRLLDERQDARRGRTPITQIEVYNGDGELVEVMPLPYRLYELDDAGRRATARLPRWPMTFPVRRCMP